MTEKQTTTMVPKLALPKAPWRLRYWRIEPTNEKLAHRVPGGRGKPKKLVPVPHHRLVPVDLSRYTGERLRESRKTHR
jgi:hypothetical protein